MNHFLVRWIEGIIWFEGILHYAEVFQRAFRVLLFYTYNYLFSSSLYKDLIDNKINNSLE